MNKHEVEALSEMIKSWPLKGYVVCHKAIEEIEDYLDSLPAPDEGLREGLEGKIKELRDDADKRLKFGHSFIAEGILKVCDDIDFVLAKTPDGWLPIEDAPRDGREIVGWFREQDGEQPEEFIKWDADVRGWKDRFDAYWGESCFTHYREKPAPPREGKECES